MIFHNFDKIKFMKNSIIFVCTGLLFACSNPEMDKLQQKLDESKCRVEFSNYLLENGIIITNGLKENGFGSELDQFEKMQRDTTVTCEQLKAEWDKLSNKLSSKLSK